MPLQSPKKQALDAETAGINYATEQLESEYFMNWVGDQLVEASQMPPEEVLPLETIADARKIARNMLQQLEWDTKRDLSKFRNSGDVERLTGSDALQSRDAFFAGLHRGLTNPSTVEWLAEEILEMSEGMRGGSAEIREQAVRERNVDPTAWYIDIHKGDDLIRTAGPYSSKQEAAMTARKAKRDKPDQEWGDPYQGMDMGHALKDEAQSGQRGRGREVRSFRSTGA